jgi:tetratricopeptide (TPR) repeat protein
VNDSYKYKAYISYSHRNEKYVKWLHGALESYRVPRKLVGTKTSAGTVPSRARPIFRDRDDLSSATDLGGTVNQALLDSENMIVVCSPDAAASFWVNEEIRHFARLGKADRIFCIIVDGEPAGPGTPSTCFPEALAEVGLKEPLAADIRKWADGKHLSKLKLVSGMLGLPLDQLRRRDLQKRQKVWAMAAVASVVLAAVLVTAITARIAAQQRRDSGESLVAYKLSELRTMLNVSSDPEELMRLKQWDQQDLARLIAMAGDEENALMDLAMEMRKEGIVLYRQRSLEEALEKYQQSWLLLAEIYRQDRGNQAAFFELGQGEFYIGQVHADMVDMKKAEEAFMAYAEITRRLILLQPENSEWVLEMAFALTNLGDLGIRSGDNDPQRSLQLIQSALEYNQIALVLDPENEYYKSELGQSHAFLADAQRGVCDLEGALLSRQKNVSLEREMLEGDVENRRKITRLAWGINGYSAVQKEMGNTAGAIGGYEQVLQLMEPELQKTPDDRKLIQFVYLSKHRLAMQWALNGQVDRSVKAMNELGLQWQSYFEPDVTDDLKIKEAYTAFLTDRAWVAHMAGDDTKAERWLNESIAISTETLKKLPGNRGMGNLLMLATFRLWEIKQELPTDSILTLLPYYYSNSGSVRACFDASMAARKAIMLGATARAVELTGYLIEKGYAEKNFIRACKAHALCNGSN